MASKLNKIFNQFFGKHSDPIPVESANDQINLAAAIVMVEMTRDRTEVDSSCQKVFTTELVGLFNLSEKAASLLEKHADAIDAEATSLFPFTHLLNEHFDYDQKLDLIKALWDAAKEIHGIDRDEDIYIHKISKLLHVSYRDLMNLKPD